MESKINALGEKMISLTQHVSGVGERRNACSQNNDVQNLDFFYSGLASNLHPSHPGAYCFANTRISTSVSINGGNSG